MTAHDAGESCLPEHRVTFRAVRQGIVNWIDPSIKIQQPIEATRLCRPDSACVFEPVGRNVEAGYANASLTQEPKPMTRTAADFKNSPLEVPPDEDLEGLLDARVLVLAVPPVVSLGNRVVVNLRFTSAMLSGNRRTATVPTTCSGTKSTQNPPPPD